MLLPWKLPPCPFDIAMINCSNIKVYMDRCMIVTFSKTFWIWDVGEVGAAWQCAECRCFHHCLFTVKMHLMPSQLNFTTAMALCMGYCLELHLSFFLSSFISEWSKWFVSGFIVCIYWTMKYLGIYNRGVIDNHFIPCCNTVCKRTIQHQCQTTQKSPFTWEWALLSKSYSS